MRCHYMCNLLLNNYKCNSFLIKTIYCIWSFNRQLPMIVIRNYTLHLKVIWCIWSIQPFQRSNIERSIFSFKLIEELLFDPILLLLLTSNITTVDEHRTCLLLLASGQEKRDIWKKRNGDISIIIKRENIIASSLYTDKRKERVSCWSRMVRYLLERENVTTRELWEWMIT